VTLATRCPVCQALFRVGPEQLRARAGQVRCGRCNEVFDGLAHLVSESPGKTGAVVEITQPPAAEAPEQATATEPATATVVDATPAIRPAVAQPAAVYEPAPAPATALDRPQQQWKMLAVSALLLVLLVAQLALRQRDMLAAQHPALRGTLAALCAVVGCEVRLPRSVDRLAIEGNEMVAENAKEPSRVVLIATLRNNADFPVAFPALELSLQDAQAEVLARRVLRPADYLAAGTDPAQGIAARGEVDLRLNLDTGPVRAEGYRLFLFYP
jgi:predicted Zn finger-like uncharacterized protein